MPKDQPDTLPESPAVVADPPAPEPRKTIEQWMADKGVPEWKLKCAHAFHPHFAVGLILDEVAFDKAIHAATTFPNR